MTSLIAGLLLAMSSPAFADPLSGPALYADVQRYESFGPHRYGSPGAERALDWIAEELERAGLKVSSQHFSLPRQYDFEAATLRVGGETRPVMPQWWIPEQQATFALTAPIAASDSGLAAGSFVRLTLPFDRGAYLTRSMSPPSKAPSPPARCRAAHHRSSERRDLHLQRRSEAQPWPVPVILVAPKGSVAARTRHSNPAAGLRVGAGAWRRDVPAATSWPGWTAARDVGLRSRRR